MRLAWRLTRDAHGAVTQGRDLDPDRAMLGCSIDEAPARAARLHALCPMAHRIAVAAALGAHIRDEEMCALEREAALACVLRFTLHWPLALRQAPDARAGAAQAAARTQDDALLAEILHTLATCPATRAIASIAGEALAGMPDPQAPALPIAARFDAMIQDSVLRAAALRRHCRLSDIRAAPHAATVATARGDLTVRLTIRAGVIMAFKSVSPTDRVFAADGPAGAVMREARDTAQARMAFLALDPCAAPDITIMPEAIHA